MDSGASGYVLPLIAFGAGLANPRAASESQAALNSVLAERRAALEREQEAQRFAESQRRFGLEYGLQQASGQRAETTLQSQLGELANRRAAANLVGQLPAVKDETFSLPAVPGLPAMSDLEGAQPSIPGIPMEAIGGAAQRPTTYAEANEALTKLLEGKSEDVASAARERLQESTRFPSIVPPEVQQRRAHAEQARALRETLLGANVSPETAQNIARMAATGSTTTNEFVQEALKPTVIPHVTASHAMTIDRKTGRVTSVTLLPQAPRESVSIVTDQDGKAQAVGVIFNPETRTLTPVIKPLGIQTKHPAGSDLMGGLSGEDVSNIVMSIVNAPSLAHIAAWQKRLPADNIFRELTPEGAWTLANKILEAKQSLGPAAAVVASNPAFKEQFGRKMPPPQVGAPQTKPGVSGKPPLIIHGVEKLP